jgi:hypothetical protein
MKDVCLLSFGTGHVRHFYEDQSDAYDWGYMQWLPKISNILWDGMVKKSESLCESLLEERYFRLNPTLTEDIPMDQLMVLPELVRVASEVDLEPTKQWIRKHLYAVDSAEEPGQQPPSTSGDED